MVFILVTFTHNFKGEEGKSFYIIIKGSTYVLLKIENKIQSRKEFSKRIFIDTYESNPIEPPENIRGSLDEILLSEIDENAKKNAVEKHNPGFLIIKELGKGEAFGEVALSKDGDGFEINFYDSSIQQIFLGKEQQQFFVKKVHL